MDSPNLTLKRIKGNEDVSVEDSRNIFGMGGQIINRPANSGSLLRRTCNYSDLTSSPAGANVPGIGSKKLMTGSPQLDIAKAAAVQDKLQIEDNNNNNNIKVKSVKAKQSIKNVAGQTGDKTKKSLSKLGDSNNNNKPTLTSQQVSENRLPKALEKTSNKKPKKIFSTKNVAKIIQEVIKSDAVNIDESKSTCIKHSKPKKKSKTATKDVPTGKRKNSVKNVPEAKVEEKLVPGILQLDMNNNNTVIDELLKEAAGMLQSNSSEKPKTHSKRKSNSKKKKTSTKIVAKESRLEASTNQVKKSKKSKSKDKEPKSQKKSKSKGVKNKVYTVNTLEVVPGKADLVQMKGARLFNSDKCGGDTAKNILMTLPGNFISRKIAHTKLVPDTDASKRRQMTPLHNGKSEKLIHKAVEAKNNSCSSRSEKWGKSYTSVKDSPQVKVKTELESLVSKELNKSQDNKNSTKKGKAKPCSTSIGDGVKIKLKINADGDLQKSGDGHTKSIIDESKKIPKKKKGKKVASEEESRPSSTFKIKKNKKLSNQCHDMQVIVNNGITKDVMSTEGAGSMEIQNPEPKNIESGTSIERQNSCNEPSTSQVCLISADAEIGSSQQVIEAGSQSEADIIEINLPQNSLKASNDDEKKPETPITVKFPELLEFSGPINVEYDVFMAAEETEELLNVLDDGIDVDDDEDDDKDSDESGSIALRRKKQKEMLKKFLEKNKPDLKGVKGILGEDDDEDDEEEEEEDEEEVEEEEEIVYEEPVKKEKKPKKPKEKKKSIRNSIVQPEEENNNDNPWWAYQNAWGMDPSYWGQMGQNPWDQTGQNPWDQTGENPWVQMMGQNVMTQMMTGMAGSNYGPPENNPYSQYPGANAYGPYPYPPGPYPPNYGYDPCCAPPPPPDRKASSSSCEEESSSCSCTESSSSSSDSGSDSCSECDKPGLKDDKSPMIPLACQGAPVKYRQGYEIKPPNDRFMPCIKTTQAGAISFTLPSKVQHKTTIRVAHFPQPVNDTTIINGVPQSQLGELAKSNQRPRPPIGINLPSNFPMPSSNCFPFNQEIPQCSSQGSQNNPLLNTMLCNTEPNENNLLMPTMQQPFQTDLDVINFLMQNQSAQCQNSTPIGANRPYQTLYVGPRTVVNENGDTVIYDL